jgi:saccharopine dehydrogenase (NAD+, L-lysine-forming)
MEKTINNVLVIGAGNVGGLVTILLNNAGFKVTAMDIHDEKGDNISPEAAYIKGSVINNDGTPSQALKDAIATHDLIIPMLKAQLVPPVAKATHNAGKSYIDPTEVVETTEYIRALSENNSLMIPQSGLAPGFIGILGGHLARQFDEGSLKDIKLMVGALPQDPIGHLKWASSWSPVGMIIECMEDCNVVLNGTQTTVPALTGGEDVSIGDETFRAAYTSGGLGTIPETFKVSGEASYKTIRHDSLHWRMMRRIISRINSGNLTVDDMAAMIIEKYPPTDEDRVVVYAEVSGTKNGAPAKDKFSADFRPIEIAGNNHTTIAWTTSAGIVAVAELARDRKLTRDKDTNFVRQEGINFTDFLNTTAGQLYASQSRMLESISKGNGREK